MSKNNTRDYIWVEQYRPKTLNELVLPLEFREKFQSYIKEQEVPHLLLFGRAGTGKTTVAKILMNLIPCDSLYINSSDENNVETMRTKIKGFGSSVGLMGDLKLIVLDEFDYVTLNAQAILRNLMEQLYVHTRFILTCNYLERVIDPIKSRCQLFKMAPPSRESVKKRCIQILDNEEVKYKEEVVDLIIKATYPDIRGIINSLQRYSRDGKLEISKGDLIEQNFKLKLLEFLDEKNAYNNIRKLLSEANVLDYPDLYRFLFDNISEKFSGEKYAEALLKVSEYMWRESFCVDKELNFMALVVELLLMKVRK